jgi:hypothetical protein
VYSVCEINSKRFFLGTFWGGGVILDLDKYIFLWQRWFFGGSSHIQVNTVYVRANVGVFYFCTENRSELQITS